MLVEISKAELIDKITILEIKEERIKDFEKLVNVRTELNILRELEFPTHMKCELKHVNNTIWELEDRIRILEKNGEFNDEFIDKARNIYKYNDERARIKKEINLNHNSNIIEEKSY